MKIGILTFHYAHNYGAVLQAYALKTYLESMGHSVYILDYRNKYIEQEYPKKLHPRFPKKYFYNPTKWKKIKESIERCYYSKDSWEKRFNKFDEFINIYLLGYEDNNWRDLYQNCDLIFFGSDQIWEENIVGIKELVYFGKIKTKAKKISYAASCFDPNALVKSDRIKEIKNFDKISVREESVAKIINRYYPDIDVKTVVDPVFLLKKGIYKEISLDLNIKNYTLAYFVTENTELSKICDYIRNVEKKKVIEIHFFNTKQIRSKWQLTDIGPREFLGLFLGAEEIITNSFHGTAFSLIFHKQFWSLSKNVRVVDILNKFDMYERCVESFDNWNEKKRNTIDYSSFDYKMQSLVSDSENFINQAIEMVGKM